LWKHRDGSRLLSEAGKVDLFQRAYDELFSWCRTRDFAGHDPFDALNSTLFQATPLAQSRNARFIWTQLVKRSPVDVRPVVRVPAERNAKGVALFALALLANHRRVKTEESRQQANEMLATLLSMTINGYSGIVWGYNFDWQSRNFFARKQMPTIVATAFAARALVEGGLHEEARSVCEFIKKDLPRTVDNANEVCFSYAPNSNTRVFNASLLAAEVLATAGNGELSDLAERATRYVVNNQRPDGSWFYGADPKQSWIDNFHTAYILFSLHRIINSSSFGSEFQPALERGYAYWKNNFFLADGWPKYYDHNPYPADAHAAASAIVTFLECRSLDSDALKMAQKVASWTIQHLRDRRGFFYYQRRRFYTIRKPFMRWTEAWMLYALARLLEEEQCQSQQT
jgi:hypothetical protein